MASLLTGNKFDPNKDIPDLAGKIYVVTGGSAGIGFGIVAHLLQHQAKVYLLSNKEEHAEEAVEELKEWGDVHKIEWVQCNLADLKHTDSVAKKLKAELKTLDGLICNAGLGVGKYSETGDGLESHFQVNHLSQLHLALELLPVLLRTPSSRLALQSSDLHRGSPSSTTFADVSAVNTDIGAANLYNRSKLAQVLTVRTLVRRMEEKKHGFDGTKEQVWINAVHPGGVSTDQQEQAVDAYGKPAAVAVKAIRPFMKDPVKEGCRPALFAAASPDIVSEKIQGEYIVPDKKVTSVSSQGQDVALGERLWSLSINLLKEKLGSLSYEA
ncbi:MAG: hypothetical protein M1833_003982 [Piccolia ochrophora]|nr:MAG: hypothetical protein M1833_003982 [Piccolia ochrophora]